MVAADISELRKSLTVPFTSAATFNADAAVMKETFDFMESPYVNQHLCEVNMMDYLAKAASPLPGVAATFRLYFDGGAVAAGTDDGLPRAFCNSRRKSLMI